MPLPRPAVVLFDIDGTLVDCGGAGRRAVARAFAEVVGAPDAVSKIAFGGMTDRGIVREGLATIGVAYEATLGDRILARYLELLDEELATSAGFRLIEGGDRAVEHARALGHAVGLGTGNVREGARRKLERAGLWGRFEFGGYGCDAEARDELLRVGERRGRERLGHATVTWVIGDTPRDVSAARAIGARVIAVTTGRFDRAALEGADLVVDRLDDPEVPRALSAAS